MFNALTVRYVPEGRSKLGLAMADTFSSLNVHFVFRTKNRQPLPMDEIKERFWAFMGGIAKQNEKSRSASVELQVMRNATFVTDYYDGR